MSPESCLFCEMASGAMEVPRVAESERAFAIKDINPRAPVHILVIPREHIPTALDIEAAHAAVLADMFVLARSVAVSEGISDAGCRLAFNVGDDAGMTIPHLHLHVVGGRRLGPEG